ncbi:zinc finger protein on ecdysone puffs [Copidosoma floridanum]|uniref:zinc finger protein on ecdysone puffs n=1 Tax=Copidosoma floridanum TaxID=29053 RepID=UPI0006C9D284|nr:zinc finger protein on ecdysone puffs [Copidosoma floridanum]
MAFNRGGVKRDNFGNRNFNRGMGGGGGGGGGGGVGNTGIASRIGNMGGSGIVGGGMSPWESGMMPGRGILPTPNNNISLASPQAQLAIASDLISNLLRGQQANQPQVPSLLSLGNNFSGPSPNFSNQQNFNQNRFVDRNIRPNMKNQRVQPYNKMGNRARDGVVGRRGPQQSRGPSGNQRQGGNQNQRNDNRSSKAITTPKQTQNQTIKKEEKQEKTSDKTNEKAEASVALSNEENEESEESKKREWMDEKKELSSDRKDADNSSGERDEEKSPSKKSAARHAESRYSDVPISSMYCHVCKKYMWDGSSFENHLRGRAHLLMMEKLDESYKLKVELMRHDLGVAEEQRELILNNSKRRGKKISVDLSVREYCTMCDLNFYGTLSSHRKSEKHQQLKTFLHPRCFPCSKEFPSRIEYDEHCLTPSHMKNAAQNEEQKKNKKKDKLSKGESDVRSAEDEEKDIGDLKLDQLDDSSIDVSDFVTDIPEGEIESKLKIPSFKLVRSHSQLAVGRSFVQEVTGYNCEKCHRFMLTEEDLNAHLHSITHYRNFVAEIKSLQAAAENAGKAEKEGEENESKDDSKGDIEPDEKRAKLENNVDKDDDANEDEKNEDEKYDPAEANGDSDEDNNDDNQDAQNDDESTAISINAGEDNILEENNDNDEEEEREEPPPKPVQQTNARTPARSAASQRARGNRARRSRR